MAEITRLEYFAGLAMQQMQVPYGGAIDTAVNPHAYIAQRAFELALAMEKQAKLHEARSSIERTETNP